MVPIYLGFASAPSANNTDRHLFLARNDALSGILRKDKNRIWTNSKKQKTSDQYYFDVGQRLAFYQLQMYHTRCILSRSTQINVCICHNFYVICRAKTDKRFFAVRGRIT